VPSACSTTASWSMSFSPGNNGELLIISPMTHPTAHMSTERSYCRAPYSSSGARYQLEKAGQADEDSKKGRGKKWRARQPSLIPTGWLQRG
jgi:hypothetical protein